ncbi:HD-GYP domain-containing protein [Fusibacter sp. JL216-2]|uniref:HD-GYP domain-containing protein n=1 Tax=Fusibacter sp. JL216-2 TaxID=3071453 RepID=UPI003D336B73
MRLVSVDNIEEDDILGKSIYSTDAALLLSAGVKLSPLMIKSLKKNSIYYIYIEDELSHGIEPVSVIPDELKIKSVTKIEKIMKKTFANGNMSKGNMIDQAIIGEYRNIVKELFDTLVDMPDRLYNMVELMGTDMYTYAHSVNVTVLSIVLGLALKIDHEKIKHMSIGALMHDIGKMCIPESVLNKPSRLTQEEFEKVKTHVKMGYELVQDDITLSGISKQIIYGHHERLDGSGYPRGLKNENISVYTRIVSICDMFDAMTSDRVYQRSMPVYKALDVMMAEAIMRIDADLLKALIDNVAIYRPGETVLLEDGRKGIIVDVRKGYTTRPIIRIIEDPLNQPPYEIDLKYDLSVFIKETVAR